jgi:hypothetical protein
MRKFRLLRLVPRGFRQANGSVQCNNRVHSLLKETIQQHPLLPPKTFSRPSGFLPRKMSNSPTDMVKTRS